MTYETLIFDLDGTISDPFVGISRSVNFALESCGYSAADPEAFRPWIGPPLNEIFQHFAGDVGEDEMAELVSRYRERYIEIGYAENDIYDGIPGTISSLSDAGYVLGVCTAKRSDYARKTVEHFGLDAYFDFVDGGGIGVTKIQQLARIVDSGIRAQSAVMIGDRKHDILGAKANGIRSVAAMWGFGSQDEIQAAKPDDIASKPEDLAVLFAR